MPDKGSYSHVNMGKLKKIVTEIGNCDFNKKCSVVARLKITEAQILTMPTKVGITHKQFIEIIIIYFVFERQKKLIIKIKFHMKLY